MKAIKLIFFSLACIILIPNEAKSISYPGIILAEANEHDSMLDSFKLFDRQMMKDFFNDTQRLYKQFELQDSVLNSKKFSTVKTEENEQEYKIIIDLKKFGNDEKNIDFEVKNNLVTISGNFAQKDERKNFYNTSSFYKAFSLPKKIDAKIIKKSIENNKLIYTIPKAEPDKMQQQEPLNKYIAPPQFQVDDEGGNFI